MKPSLARFFLLTFLLLEVVISASFLLLYRGGLGNATAGQQVEIVDAKRLLTTQIQQIADAVRDIAVHVAAHPQTVSSFNGDSERERLIQQQNIRAFYPNVEIQLLPINSSSMNSYYSAPMSTIHTRMLATDAHGGSSPAVAEHFSVSITQPVTDSANNLRGFVVVDKDIPELKTLFEQLQLASSYVELQQFNVSRAYNVLQKIGRENLKTGSPTELLDIPGTTWRLAVWNEPLAPRTILAEMQPFWLAWGISSLALAVILGVLYLALRRVIGNDLSTIVTLFGDVRHNRLRKSYRTGLADFEEFFGLMVQLGKMTVGKQKQTVSEAALDHLSQVHNRRSFEEKQRELYKSTAEGWTHTLLIMDIDNFKQVNDTFGHEAGDALIVQFGKALKEHLRSSDFIARLGGDEFCVIFPNTPLKKGQELAERLRASMPPVVELTPGIMHKLQWSGGLGEYHRDDSSETMALSRADAALLEAKRNGRNLTRVQAAA